jgi:Holliday junction resolvase RusA-like endonuclease
MNWKRYEITPLGKPRMTQRDKWKQRPCVMRYRAFKDQCREAGIELGEKVSVIFVLPMPKSWSKKKKDEMRDQPHQQKPDIDNLQKALFDAVLEDDSGIWSVNCSKFWGDTAFIEILNEGEDENNI